MVPWQEDTLSLSRFARSPVITAAQAQQAGRTPSPLTVEWGGDLGVSAREEVCSQKLGWNLTLPVFYALSQRNVFLDSVSSTVK